MKNILIVDDDISVCNVLFETVSEAGFVADHVYSKQDALKKLQREDYEVVITDMRMKEAYTSGLVVLKAAKAKSPDIQVIVLTAYGDVDDAVQSMQAGAFTYVQKNAEGERGDGLLLQQISRALDFRRLVREERRLLSEQKSLNKRLLSGLDLISSKLPELAELIQLLERLKEEVSISRRPTTRRGARKKATVK